MKKHDKKKISLIILSFLLVQAIGSSLIQNVNDMDNSKEISDTNNLMKKDQGLSNMNLDSIPFASTGETPSTWWNESYSYRLGVEINNSNSFSESKPIDLFLTFPSDHAHNDSIRIVKYTVSGEVETWTPIPCQVWNSTAMNPDNSHLLKATITFVENSLDPGSNMYYIYYDPEETFDPTDFSGNTFSTTLTGNNLTVDWDDAFGKDYHLEMDKYYGAYKLEDNYGINRFTGNSTSPGVLGLEKNLVGYWNFDDDTPQEQTGNVPGGAGVGYVEHGNPTYSAGKYGNAIFMDGSGDYYAVNGDEALYGGKGYTEGITVMAWIKPTSASGERMIASWDRSEYWRLSFRNNNEIWWATKSDVSNSVYDDFYVDISTLGLFDGNWHHVAAVYNPVLQTKTVYVDGEFIEDKSAHPHGQPLGYADYPARYGFIGTGSEANSFDGTVGPNNEWNGGLDEVRIYSSALDGDDINLTKELPGRVSSINSINEVINGDVMSVYDVLWEDTVVNSGITMIIQDTWWFYRSLNAWKVNRTYFWDSTVNPTVGNRFAAWNTLFNWDPYDDQLITQDWYYYDDQMHEGHSNVDFTPENYTVLHDYDGNNLYTALGLFITNKQANYPSMTFNELKWKISVNDLDDIINFIPGNETDLNTQGSGSEYSIGIDYWAYVRNDVDSYTSASNAKDYFDDYYQSLTTDSIITIDEEESLFFNFEVNVYDHDGNDVPGVNVTLLNYTTGPYFTKYVDSDLSNGDGNVTFYSIPANNYTVNLTYDPYGGSNVLFLGEHNVTINHTETTYLNTKMISFKVNMTSLVLHFESITSDDLVGALIRYEENSTGTYEYFGSEITDINGNATLRWTNFTADQTQINFTCEFLGGNRFISSDGGSNFYSDLQMNMESISYHNITAQLYDFNTTMTLTDLSPVDWKDDENNTYTIWGQNLVYNITYSYNETIPIEGAEVTYLIQSRDEIVGEGAFVNTVSDGASYNILNYTLEGIDLRAGIGYTLRVSVSKPGFTPLVGISNIQLADINATLTPDIGMPNSIEWRENITLSMFYNDIFNDEPIDSALISFVDLSHPEINGVLTPEGNGWYSIELNSSETFSEIGTKYLKITASRQNYETKEYDFEFEITAISTSFTLEDESIEVFWNYNFSIDVFFEETSSGDGLENADVSWSLVTNPSISGILEKDITKESGWYSVIVNSSIFTYAGDYSLRIEADLANYFSLPIYVQLTIEEIETQIQLNDNDPTSGLYTLILNLYETDSYEFSFSYINDLTDQNIADTSIQLFSWYSNITSGALPQTGNIIIDGDQYILDFDTSEMEAGSYTLLVTFGELNHEQRQAIISLIIEKRIISYDLGTEFDGSSIEIVAGDALLFSVSLIDLATQTPLLNATVVISFSDGKEPIYLYDDNNDGIYTANKTYSKEQINAFFRDNTFEGTLTISADHYSQIETPIYITIKMDEVFEGFPTFYLLLGAVGLVIAIGSLVGYKLVQNARIPAFVKMINKVISDISGKKTVSDDNISVSAKEEIIEKFDEYWKLLDLDLNEILGLTKGSVPSDEVLSSSEEATGGI